MRKILLTFVLCLFSALQQPAAAQDNPLTPAQWREDIDAAVAAIRETHPDPFRSASESEFDTRVNALIADLPNLAAKDVTLRLAALVSMIEDGHTRLSLPREHPEFAFDPGHTGPDEPAHRSLYFSTLPFRFSQFSDGIHIVEAAAGFERHLGAKVVAFDKTRAENAAAAMRPILDAENEMGVKLLAADRLAIPDVLRHFGLIGARPTVTLTLERKGQTEAVDIAPLSENAKVELISPTFLTPPLASLKAGDVKWHARVPGERAWYVRIDEIEAFPEVPLSDFMAGALKAARRARADRLILDLRSNHGGSASFNPSIINALARSEFNQHGRLFVLTGRETFSAAAMLMRDFEQYTNAIFVGEPAGSRPSGFGDPKKIRLPNSGLTLRVSTTYWQSWLAADFRPFIETHIDAPPSAADFFAGRDPAVEAALDYVSPGGVAAQMAELFDKEKLQSGIVRFLTWLNSPAKAGHDAVAEIVGTGHRYLDAGELKKGRFMMTIARDYYPASADARAGLGRAMELNGDLKSARKRYKEALEREPQHQAAAEGLARLPAEQ